VGAIRKYLRFTRPFTLLPPTLGVISGAITAWGSASNPHVLAGLPRQWTPGILWTIVLGSACAALLNAASNTLNQIYDLENDRLNKPHRALCTGTISMRAAGWFTLAIYLVAVLPTWLVVVFPAESLQAKFTAPISMHQCFFIYIAGLLLTLVYSMPLLGRTKANTFGANLTIALPRGCLLKVAGWSMVASVFHVEPWYIGSIFFFFLLGAATTKDFSDMKGDEAAGCNTLPIRYGVTRAAKMISPFFILPWLMIPAGAYLTDPFNTERTILTGNPVLLVALGIVLALWGAYTVYLILKDPEDLAKAENHPSWTHMYLMMMFAQVGFGVAYLF
jgi:4-hydroxybenzoate polyprenyltransferase